MIEEILIAPIYVLIFSLVFEKGIHQSDVISLLAHKFRLCICGFSHFILRTQENVGRVQAGHDGKHFINALIFGRSEKDLGELGL
jgi:hypothetical protein